MNTELLKSVRDAILANPDHLDMDTWARTNCNTTGCIGGWAVSIDNETPISTLDAEDLGTRSMLRLALLEQAEAGKLDPDIYFEDYAQDLLDLSGHEADSLFYLIEWPESFSDAYHFAKTPKGRAYVTACRIAEFAGPIKRPPSNYLPEKDEDLITVLP